MEHIYEARRKAKKYLSIADRMLTQTFAMLKDTKLFIAVIENIFLSVASEVSALMHYEHAFKRVEHVEEDYNKVFTQFKSGTSEKYGLDDFEPFIDEITALRYGHKKADVEFSRKALYVMCAGDYSDCRIVSEEKLKNFIKTGRLLIEKIEEVMSKNEGLFS